MDYLAGVFFALDVMTGCELNLTKQDEQHANARDQNNC